MRRVYPICTRDVIDHHNNTNLTVTLHAPDEAEYETLYQQSNDPPVVEKWQGTTLFAGAVGMRTPAWRTLPALAEASARSHRAAHQACPTSSLG